MARKASKALEAFINEAIRQCARVRYYPTTFQGMRDRHGTLEAIERLVLSGELQSGFKRLKAENLLEWSVEAAVIKFSSEFAPSARECAEFRLRLVKEFG